MNLALLLRGYPARLLIVCLVCHLLEKITVERKTIQGGGGVGSTWGQFLYRHSEWEV